MIKSLQNEDVRRKIPSKSAIIEARVHLDTINWKAVNISNIKTVLTPPLDNILPIIGPGLPVNYLYRARTLSSFNDPREIGYKKQFGYPDKSIVKTFGRANLKYDPVFYCALNLTTAIAETNPEEKIHFVGKWEIVPKTWPLVAMFIDSVTSIEVQKWKMSIIENCYSFLTKEERERLLMYNTLLESEYLKDVAPYRTFEYKYSAFWSYRILNGSNGAICAIVYPSIRIRNNVNFAISKDFANSSLKLKRVYKLSHEFNGSTVSATVLSVGIPKGDIIIWRKPTVEDIQEYNKEDHIGYYPVRLMKKRTKT